MSDSYLCRLAARAMLRCHGDRAAVEAARAAAEFAVAGNVDGYEAWHQVTLVIDGLLVRPADDSGDTDPDRWRAGQTAAVSQLTG